MARIPFVFWTDARAKKFGVSCEKFPKYNQEHDVDEALLTHLDRLATGAITLEEVYDPDKLKILDAFHVHYPKELFVQLRAELKL